MKKILYYHTIFFLLIALLASCKKQGPDGPEGPEGPAGNPGPPGSSGGTGNGAVIAYASETSNVFRWEKNDFVAGTYTLSRAANPTSINYDEGFYVEDREGYVPDGITLVYVKMKRTTSTQDPAWFALPHISGNTVAGGESFEAWMNYRDQTGNNDYLAVRITDDVLQTNPAAVIPPQYTVSGVKIIVIAAGLTSSLEGRAVNPKTLSLEEVMTLYNIKESDFKVIR